MSDVMLASMTTGCRSCAMPMVARGRSTPMDKIPRKIRRQWMSKRRSGERPNILHGRKKTLPVNTATARRPEHGRVLTCESGGTCGFKCDGTETGVCVTRSAFPHCCGRGTSESPSLCCCRDLERPHRVGVEAIGLSSTVLITVCARLRRLVGEIKEVRNSLR